MGVAQASTWLGDVCVLGMGSTGVACARYLAALGPERVRSVTLYGGLSAREGDVTAELRTLGVRVIVGTEDVTGHYDLTVSSPGISEFSDFFAAAKRCSDEVIGEPELAFRESPGRWLGITGSNGKTTTTTLATRMLTDGGLSAVAVGNIGNLAISEVAGRPADEWFVAELSSFQLACTRFLHPRAACLLNVTPDHLEWHRTLEAYACAKERIFANLTALDLAIVTSHDRFCTEILRRLIERGLAVCRLDAAHDFGGPNAAFVREGRLVVRLDDVEHVLAQAQNMPLKGAHNLENALAASAMALFVGVEDDEVTRTLESFQPLEHRLEPAGVVGGVRFVNDSKATNTDSVEKALATFEPGRVLVLLGGHDKQTDLGSLARVVAARCRVAVCYGEAGPRIAWAVRQAAASGAGEVAVVERPHLREAFDAAASLACAGEVVLLSPACSSFDEFHNMGERGRFFKELVRQLARERG